MIDIGIFGGVIMDKAINIVFDGPPGPISGRFVEVEDDKGEGMSIGEWDQKGDYWVLRITKLPKYKFDNVSCSQCGRDFGPGDHGFSHCIDHNQKIHKGS